MRHGTLPAPLLPAHLPADAQWLAGEGAGSWFVVRVGDAGGLAVERSDPEGKSECTGVFQSLDGPLPDLSAPYVVTFPSHCAIITLQQNGRTFRFGRTG